MAQVVQSMPRPKYGPIQHDFLDWMDGQIWQLDRGTDFTCEPESMRRQLNRYAKSKGLTLEVHQDSRAGSVWVRRL